jgi:hypothetical protein
MPPPKKTPKKAVPRLPSLPPGRQVEWKSLKDLHFDVHNPRFGPDSEEIKDEAKVLDRIVNDHGVGDLLSSLAVNGYSDAEPVIGIRQKNGSVVIKEGNRRLAACLILSDDPRAKNQEKRVTQYTSVRKEYGKKPVDPVPVMVFEEKEYGLVLPYLGVKHIVGPEGWSSWAKAAWAHEFIQEKGMTLDKAMAMVGDEQRQLPRILASYYFVRQLIEEGRFDPNDSVKKGGGGSPFPFSLVYNALGYGNIKTWTGFSSESNPKLNPIPAKKLDAAADLMDFICGSRKRGVKPAVRDNREFAALNRIAENQASLKTRRTDRKGGKAARAGGETTNGRIGRGKRKLGGNGVPGWRGSSNRGRG